MKEYHLIQTSLIMRVLSCAFPSVLLRCGAAYAKTGPGPASEDMETTSNCNIIHNINNHKDNNNSSNSNKSNNRYELRFGV